MSDIERVIKKLKERYEYAKKQEWVANPMGWALYYTWREEERRNDSK